MFQSAKCDDYQIADSTMLLDCYHGLRKSMESIAVLPRPLAVQPPLQEQLADMQLQLKEAAENGSGVVLLTSVCLAGNVWAFRAVSHPERL